MNVDPITVIKVLWALALVLAGLNLLRHLHMLTTSRGCTGPGTTAESTSRKLLTGVVALQMLAVVPVLVSLTR